MNNLPAGAEHDSRAPFNDKSNGLDLSHLCPSCDEVEKAAREMLSEDNYEDDMQYEMAIEELKDTAKLCYECHKLDMHELH